MLDNTTFGVTAKSRKKGLDVITADLEGLFEAPDPDKYVSTLGLFNITGTATGGSTTTLIDTTKNFTDEGIVVGAIVMNITDGGQTQLAGVTSITTTTQPHDTLNFAALTAGADFAGGGDSYKVIVPYIPMSIAPHPEVGVAAYFFKSQNVEYSWGGTVGELAKFSVKSESVGEKMIRGFVLENGSFVRAATGQGAALGIGAVGAAEYLYGVLHVISSGTSVGDTLDVVIESDDVATFDGSPEDQIAFTQVLGNGGGTYEWATPVVGAITDIWWRCKWTIVSDDDPLFVFAVMIGIV